MKKLVTVIFYALVSLFCQREYIMQHAIVIPFVCTICGQQLKKSTLKIEEIFTPLINKHPAPIGRLLGLNAGSIRPSFK